MIWSNTRRQNIRISGIPENAQPGEDTDSVVVDFAKTVLNVDIDPAEIDRSHRVGQKTTAKPTRDMIVRFLSYKSKVKIMKTKKSLSIITTVSMVQPTS